MSKFNSFENEWLRLVFNGTPIANIADNASASPATTLEVALHTADPGEGGDMATSEASYTGYARVGVARSAAGWTVTGTGEDVQRAQNAVVVAFPQATGGDETLTHFSVGVAGSDRALYSGALSTPLPIVTGVTPSFPIGSITIGED